MDCNLNVLHGDLSLLSSAYGQQQISNALYMAAEKSAAKLNASYFGSPTATGYPSHHPLNPADQPMTEQQLQAFIQMNNAYAMAAQISNNSSKSNLSSTISSPLSITTSTASLTPLTNVISNRRSSLNRSYNYETPSSSSPSSNSNSQFSACSASSSPSSNFDPLANQSANPVNNLNSALGNQPNHSFNGERMSGEFVSNAGPNRAESHLKLSQLKSGPSGQFPLLPSQNAPGNGPNPLAAGYQQRGQNTTAVPHKRSRRRVATVAQRRAANVRERKRMQSLNKAFDDLRKKVPTFTYEKRLSRIETLKLAIMYIQFMGETLMEPPSSTKSASLQAKSKILNPIYQPTNCSSTTLPCPMNEPTNALHLLDQSTLTNLNNLSNNLSNLSNLNPSLNSSLNSSLTNNLACKDNLDHASFNKAASFSHRNHSLNPGAPYWTPQQTYYAPPLHH